MMARVRWVPAVFMYTCCIHTWGWKNPRYQVAEVTKFVSLHLIFVVPQCEIALCYQFRTWNVEVAYIVLKNLCTLFLPHCHSALVYHIILICGMLAQ